VAVLRRPLAIPALLACGAVLGACGGGAPSAHTQTTTSSEAPPTPGAPKTPGAADAHAKARAVAFAHAVNLRASDLPGFSTSHNPHRQQETAREKRLMRELRQCAGGGAVAASLVEMPSREFELKGGLVTQSVSSQVTVDGSLAGAQQELARIRSGRLRTCLAHYFSALLSGLRTRGTRVSNVATRYGSPPAPGASGTFGLRVTAKLSFERFQIPVYLDYLAFVRGSADVSLRSLGTPVPFPAHAEEGLFSLLLERAKAHST
jgi:hypothetical protein